MARDICQKTMTLPDSSGFLKALAGIQIAVYKRGTDDLATIYRRVTGTTEGPAPEIGASGTNPFITGATGAVEFWVEQGQYDIDITDTQVPARITPRSGSNRVGFEAMPAGAGGLPTSILAEDGELGIGFLADEVIRQMLPIGGQINWFRPSSSVPLPDGFVVPIGQTLASDQHQFAGVSGAVTLPDLRNVFILGASTSVTDGSGARQGDTAAEAPGIRGSGGSNAAKNFGHTHGVPGVDHLHFTTTPDHLHGPPSVSAGMGTASRGSPNGYAAGGGESVAFTNHVHGISASASYTGASDRGLGAWSGGADRSLNTTTNSISWTSNPGTDFRPRFYGLLRIMKVKRS